MRRGRAEGGGSLGSTYNNYEIDWRLGMWPQLALVLLIVCAVLIAVGVVIVLLARQREKRSPAQAAAIFQRQREHLEADFFLAAARSGKPRGLRWKKCDWERDIVLARDRSSRELTALV